MYFSSSEYQLCLILLQTFLRLGLAPIRCVYHLLSTVSKSVFILSVHVQELLVFPLIPLFWFLHQDTLDYLQVRFWFFSCFFKWSYISFLFCLLFFIMFLIFILPYLSLFSCLLRSSFLCLIEYIINHPLWKNYHAWKGPTYVFVLFTHLEKKKIVFNIGAFLRSSPIAFDSTFF